VADNISVVVISRNEGNELQRTVENATFLGPSDCSWMTSRSVAGNFFSSFARSE